MTFFDGGITDHVYVRTHTGFCGFEGCGAPERDHATVPRTREEIEMDARRGKARAEEGALAALAASDDEWREEFTEALGRVARRRHKFTTDDVYEDLRPGIQTRERRAVGALMTKAAKEGLIRRADEFRESTRPEAHSNPKRVWISNIVRAWEDPT